MKRRDAASPRRAEAAGRRFPQVGRLGQKTSVNLEGMPTSFFSKQSARIFQPRSRASMRSMFTERSIISFSNSAPYLRSFWSHALILKPMDCFSTVSLYEA